MKYSELTKYEKEKFNHSACPICGSRMTSKEDFVMVRVRNSRAVVCNFLHEKCLSSPYRIEKVPDDFMKIPEVPETDWTDMDERVCPVFYWPEISSSDNIDVEFVPKKARG